MTNYISQVNAVTLYLVVAAVLLFIAIMCLVFIIKSYRAGIAQGMDKKLLKRAITSSATFTLLPSISILLGVIALSGTLGVPFSWLRLSVVGALQYELNVAEIAATASGLSGLKVSEMSIQVFATVAMVMTAGILGGVLCSLFGLKKYLGKLNKKNQVSETIANQQEIGSENKQSLSELSEKQQMGKGKKQIPKSDEKEKKPGFGAYATIAMFIGLCSAYIGSYVGSYVAHGNYMPLFVAVISAIVMAIFEYLTTKKGLSVLDNFSVAVSMLCGMIAAVVINL